MNYSAFPSEKYSIFNTQVIKCYSATNRRNGRQEDKYTHNKSQKLLIQISKSGNKCIMPLELSFYLMHIPGVTVNVSLAHKKNQKLLT